MEPVFVHHGPDGRHFGDLVSDRLGVVAEQLVAAPAALLRLALDDLAELLGRDQGSGMVAMAGLSAPLLPRGRSRRSSFDRGRVGRRGLGGVGGVLVDSLFQVGDPPFQGREQRPDSGLGFGGNGVPERLRDRGRIAHAAWYTGWRSLKQHSTIERLPQSLA
jgi:hypothetical protein